jgi:dynein heavy chain 1
VIVDYAKVQSKVSLKYDYWHREVLQKFGQALGMPFPSCLIIHRGCCARAGGEMQTFYANVSKWRSELEQQSIDTGTTSDAVALITYVQSLKKQIKTGQEQVGWGDSNPLSLSV